jgi:hypothetical protein
MAKDEQTVNDSANATQSPLNLAQKIPGFPTEADAQADSRDRPYLSLVEAETEKSRGKKSDTDMLSAGNELEFHNQSL